LAEVLGPAEATPAPVIPELLQRQRVGDAGEFVDMRLDLTPCAADTEGFDGFPVV
jgi:hypothetical protein